MPDDLYLGLITFNGTCVRIWELGSMGDRVACEAFSGKMSPSEEDIREIAKHEAYSSSQSSFVSPLQVCRESLFRTLDAIAAMAKPRPNPNAQRCVGPAVEYALQLVKVCDAPRASIVLSLSGPPSMGPGAWRDLNDENDALSLEAQSLIERDRFRAVQYFAENFHLARTLRCTIDVFCYGPSPSFAIPALLELGGRVYMRSVACAQTLAVALNGDLPGSCTVTVQISDPKRLQIAHAAGSLPLLGSDEAGSSWYSSLARKKQPKTAVSTFETNGSLTLFFEYDGSTTAGEPQDSNQATLLPKLVPGDVVVQCIAKSEFGDFERVTTLKCTSQHQHADPDAVAVLIAKRACVILASTGRSEGLISARAHVENEMFNLSRLLLDASSTPSKISPFDAPDFERLARTLFHFLRGPLVNGIGSQYSDEDGDALRARFLHRTDFAESLLMMAPSLIGWRWGRVSTSKLQTASTRKELSTLSLQSDFCLVLDQLTHVLVWFGNDVPGDAPERAWALDHATRLAHSRGRFPVSEMMVFEEKHSRARWLRCRLSPDHKDAPLQQVASPARLTKIPSSPLTSSSLSLQDEKILRVKLWSFPTDEPSFAQFMKRVIG